MATGKIYITGLFVFLLVFNSCEQSTIEPDTGALDYGSYYPSTIGFTREYQVRQITIDAPSDAYDTTMYFVKEKVADYFVDNAQDSALIIHRYFRYSSNESWKNMDVWYANRYENELHVVEENIRYVKMQNPISVNHSWDGNKYNNSDSLNLFRYTIKSIRAEMIHGVAFDSVVTIQQRYDSTLIDKILYLEKYARNVGMVYKEITEINSQNYTNAGIPIEERITTAYLLTCTLISYYHED